MSRIDPEGLDTVDISVDINLPSFPGSPTIQGSDTVKPRGISVGIAVSYPGFYGGEFDIGLIGSARAGGSEGLGTGRLSIGIGFNQGCVRDQTGESLEITFNDGIGGLTFGLDDNNTLSSVGMHIGPGIEFGVDGAFTGVISLREILGQVFDYVNSLSE